MKELISEYYPFEKYQAILRFSFDRMGKNSSAKMQNVCLLTLRKFIQTFPKEIASSKQYLNQTLDLMKQKIKELDCDKIIKTGICRCLSSLFQHYKLGSNDLSFFLDSLAHKLKIEVEKIYIIETLKCFGKQQSVNSDVHRSLENVIRQCSENLGSSNYELNIKAVETIDHLLEIMGSKCPPKLMEELLDRSKLLLGEGRIPTFVRHIGDFHPKLLKPYAELIVKSTESRYIVSLISNKVIDINNALSILKTIDQEKAKKVSETIGLMRLDEKYLLKEVHEDPWGRIMVVALGYVGSEHTLPDLYKFLANFRSD